MSDSDHLDDARVLRDQSLAFFGAVTASVSHELNNVISIVDQSAGLLADLVAGARQGRPIPEEKIERVAETVERQTQRGLGIIRRLNKFAHLVDVPELEFDLNELVDNFVALNTRPADMRRVGLEIRSSVAATAVSFVPSDALHGAERGLDRVFRLRRQRAGAGGSRRSAHFRAD
jgi:signal transduction histidine kinase